MALERSLFNCVYTLCGCLWRSYTWMVSFKKKKMQNKQNHPPLSKKHHHDEHRNHTERACLKPLMLPSLWLKVQGLLERNPSLLTSEATRPGTMTQRSHGQKQANPCRMLLEDQRTILETGYTVRIEFITRELTHF